MQHQTVILVAGIPATGKSTYCGWLHGAKGFAHLDIDRDSAVVNQQIERAGSITKFIRDFQGPTVIDWGFPTGNIPVVHLIKEAGAELWWFDGDIEAARAAFIRRKRGTLEEFEKQVRDIQEARESIAALFGDNRITVLDASGRYLPEAVICARMFGETTDTI
jgi:hypothetical protein